MVPIDRLRPHPKNPRIHPESAIDKIERSIREFGWTNPILVSTDGYILAGHARLKAAKQAGIEEVPVIYLPLEGAKAEAYMIADNRLQDETDWDAELLEGLVRELQNADFDLYLTGFDASELDDLLGSMDDEENLYTTNIKTPQYEITGERPSIDDLVDTRKADYLVGQVEAANISEGDKAFLIRAAQRHLVFDYGKIAEYYAHADEELQELMEESALVIIDYDNAIENGYVQLSKTLQELMGKDDER